MAQTKNSVIVFGPTGSVGGAAALEARQRGAHVWLAMRDTSKPIKSLGGGSKDPEGYSRVQADLTQPESVKQAVKESGATAAFIYRIQTDDNMRASVDALKEAGIQYVVFLSSFTVKPSRRQIEPSNFIGAIHAGIEVSLEESGVPFTAVRPGAFSSNLLMWNGQGIKEGEVGLVAPEFIFDWISPQNVGAVCGALLANPRPNEEPIILCGPELLSQSEAFGVVSRHLNRDIKVKKISKEEFLETNTFLPKPVLEGIARDLHDTPGKLYEGWYEGVIPNVKKYTGRNPTTLPEWVASNIE